MALRNHKPNDVVASGMFQRVAPHITSIPQSRLVYELCRASTIANVRLDNDDLNYAMTWAQTPQREEFWRHLHHEYEASRRIHG